MSVLSTAAAVLSCPASDKIVSTSLVRAAAVTPRLAGNRYGG